MINIDRILKTLQPLPQKYSILDDFTAMCNNITSDMDFQTIQLETLKHEDLINQLNLDEELAALQNICSPEELSLFLFDRK